MPQFSYHAVFHCLNVHVCIASVKGVVHSLWLSMHMVSRISLPHQSISQNVTAFLTEFTAGNNDLDHKAHYKTEHVYKIHKSIDITHVTSTSCITHTQNYITGAHQYTTFTCVCGCAYQKYVHTYMCAVSAFQWQNPICFLSSIFLYD